MNPRKLHNWLVGLWVIYSLNEEEIYNNTELLKAVSLILGFILLLIGFYYLIFNRISKKIKLLEDNTSQDNIINYLQVFIIMYCLNFTNFHPISTWIALGLYGICLIGIMFIIFKLWSLKSDVFRFNKIILFLILSFIIYNWGRNIFTIHYGNEIIGSYWSKSEFTTKYYVKLSNKIDSTKIYILPALVSYYSQILYDDYGDNSNSYTKKNIIIEKIFLSNGRYLTFEKCDLAIGRQNTCKDQNNKIWFVKLTNDKVK